MPEEQDRLEQLRSRLEALIRRHGEIAVEMHAIKDQLESLTTSESPKEPSTIAEQSPISVEATSAPEEVPTKAAPEGAGKAEMAEVPRTPSNIERWVGESLISKIGIAITILGVAIGAKYAIDKGWITPVMRIVFGYIIGIGLLYFALRLRRSYERFSAVLISGAMAIFYFITYAASAYYGLVPVTAAFGMMAAITVFTVFAALRYEMVIIGHIGLIGAYAVPFLLSEGGGRYDILFSYVALVNVGILAVSVTRYWRSLFYPSFFITWATFGLWYAESYDPAGGLALGLVFASIFFAIFYATFITYKLVKGVQFAAENVMLILANSFVFYGYVYGIADRSESLAPYLGPITLANAAVHLGVAAAVYRFSSADRTVISLLTALVITFVTIAAPVQMDGNWVTLLWIVEAAVLFVIARWRSIPLYEWFTYPLVLLAMLSLFADWAEAFGADPPPPILNPDFYTAAVFAVSLAAVLWAGSGRDKESSLPGWASTIGTVFVSSLLILVVYNCLRIEISNYWRQGLFALETLEGGYLAGAGRDTYVPLMNATWQLNYSMAFTFALWALNERFFRNSVLRPVAAFFGFVWLLMFLVGGLETLALLRDAFVYPATDVPTHGAGGILVRYASYASATPLLAAVYLTVRDASPRENGQRPGLLSAFDLFLNFFALCILSAELFTWMEIGGIADSGKLALSILWGLYAVFLLVVGISRAMRPLRIASIALFGITLFKVFLYDLSELGTVSRTILFVTLGILLLVASFLYSKYREVIFGKD